MRFEKVQKTATIGALFVLVYTLIAATGDAAAKHIAQEYSAPQLFAFSGGMVALFSFVLGTKGKGLSGLKTKCKGAMAVRSVATVLSAVLYFFAFRELSLAEVFIFIGIMPILAALMTPRVLNEAADRNAWLALGFGFLGVLWLFPEGLSGVTRGHGIAFAASLSGVVSMVMARFIGRQENNPMALLFYPHILMFLVMSLALPFVYKAMPISDLLVAGLYSALLFAGRYFLVRALSMAPAHVVMPIMNFQFLWMVLLGMGIFAESPTLNIYIGASIVILSCTKLVLDAGKPASVKIGAQHRIDAPRSGRLKWPRSKSLSRNRRNLMRSGYRSQIAHRSVPR